MSPSFRSFKRKQAPKLSPGYNPNIEKLRMKEYPQLKDQTYLDHSGTTLYAESLVSSISSDLRENLYGNPHSENPSSKLSATKIDGVRQKVLGLFKADPAHFDVVFTANTTAGVKLVADSFTGHQKEFQYRFHKDCHTSLVGPRGLAQSTECFWTDQEALAWLDSPSPPDTDKLGLFAWPGQSNFTGRRLPVNEWASKLRSNKPGHYSLFDAAALVMTSPLDLSDPSASPDFSVCSFYKMFGYPDLGALVVRRASTEVLRHRKYFGGGTVGQLMASMDHVRMRVDGDPHEHLEDGTCAFHSIIALGHAIDTHTKLYESFERISAHTASLAATMVTMLDGLRHRSTGTRVVEIYTEAKHGDGKVQGPVVTFNITDCHGAPVGYRGVEAAAAARNIHIRAGGHCNPGGVQQYCRIERDEMKGLFDGGKVCGDDQDVLNGKHIGALRASLGAMSTLEDVLRFVDFVREEYASRPLSPEERRRMVLLERRKDVEEAKKVMKKYGTVLSSSLTGKTLLCFWTDSVNLDEALPIGSRLAPNGISAA